MNIKFSDEGAKIAWQKQQDKLREKIIKRRRNERAEIMNYLRKRLGSKCILCGDKGKGPCEGKYIERIQFHQKEFKFYGKGDTQYHYKRNHPDEFVPLCFYCHLIITSVHKKAEKTLEEIKEFLNL